MIITKNTNVHYICGESQSGKTTKLLSLIMDFPENTCIVYISENLTQDEVDRLTKNRQAKVKVFSFFRFEPIAKYFLAYKDYRKILMVDTSLELGLVNYSNAIFFYVNDVYQTFMLDDSGLIRVPTAASSFKLADCLPERKPQNANLV